MPHTAGGGLPVRGPDQRTGGISPPRGPPRRAPGGRPRPPPARAVGASTITRTSGSVPLPRISTRPWSPSSASTAAMSSASVVVTSKPFVATRTLWSTWGSRVIAASARSASGRSGATHDVEELHRGQQPVAGGGQVGEHDVPALLAAERQTAVGQRLQHVAVADGHLEHLDAVLGHPEPEPEVGHHGDDDGVLGQATVGVAVDGADPDDLVAVDEPAGRVDGQHPVGVAVEGEPDVGAARHDRAPQVLGVGRAAAGVDVGAVRLVVEHLDRRRRATGAREGRPRRRPRWRSRPRPCSPSSPRPSIDPTTDSAHRSTADEPSTIVPTASPVRADPGSQAAEQRRAAPPRAPPRPRRRASCRPAVKSFTPLSAKELCEAEITAPAAPSAAGEPRHRRRGHHPERRDVDALGGEPGDQGRLEQRPRPAGVAPDHEAVAAEHASRGAPEGQHQLRRQVERSRRRARRPSRTSASVAVPDGSHDGRRSERS